MLVLLTDGVARLETADGPLADFIAGQSALLSTEVLVRATGGEPATFVVATIGKSTGGGSLWLDPAMTSPYAFYQ